MREYLRDKYDAWQRPSLEGDDLLGILSGLHDRFKGDKIMVTMDKDMSTLAGYHYRPHRSVLGVFEVTEKEADKFHLQQGIAGDPTDGYKGCPSWGMSTAEAFLDEPYKLVPETYTTARGKFAGVERTRWVKQECDDLWECILSLYAKEGVSEADALAQFQVARILRTSDYNFKKKEPILWTPALIAA
jgi:DNA polymerase-1